MDMKQLTTTRNAGFAEIEPTIDFHQSSLPARQSWFRRYPELGAAAAITASVLGMASSARAGQDRSQDQNSRIVERTDSPLAERETPGKFVLLENAGHFVLSGLDRMIGRERPLRTVTVWSTNIPHTVAVEPTWALVEADTESTATLHEGTNVKLPPVVHGLEYSSDNQFAFLSMLVELFPCGSDGQLAPEFTALARNAIRARNETNEVSTTAIDRCRVSGFKVEFLNANTGEVLANYVTPYEFESGTPYQVRFPLRVPADDVRELLERIDAGQIMARFQPTASVVQKDVASALVRVTQEAFLSAMETFKTSHSGHTGLFTDNEKNDLQTVLRIKVEEIVHAKPAALAATLLERVQRLQMPNFWTPSEVVTLAQLSSDQQARAEDHLKALVDTSEKSREQWDREVRGTEDGKTTTWKVGGGAGLNFGFVKIGGGGGRNVTESDLKFLEDGTDLVVTRIDHKSRYVEMGARVSRIDRARLSHEYLAGTFVIDTVEVDGFMKSVEVPVTFTAGRAHDDVAQAEEIIRLRLENAQKKATIGEISSTNADLKIDIKKLSAETKSQKKANETLKKEVSSARADAKATRFQRDRLLQAVVRYCRPDRGGIYYVTYGRLHELARFLGNSADKQVRALLERSFVAYWGKQKDFKDVALPPPNLQSPNK